MGYMRHHAIVVTGPLKAHGEPFNSTIEEVRNEVFRIADMKGYGCLVSGIIPSAINGTASFFVAPDGSKEGWKHSDDGDITRERIIVYLDKLRYDDGSTSFDYAEIQFGDDEGKSKVVRHSDNKLPR